MEMLIDYIDFADTYHTTTQCVNPCVTNCSSTCLLCLDRQNFRSQLRTYDCEKRCGAYVCHYLFRFFIEMRLLYREVKPLNSSVNVLSLGCGPCSELFPLVEVLEKEYEEYSINFMGIDLSDKWKLFHDEIDRLVTAHQKPINTRFVIGDVQIVLNHLNEVEFDIIVLNYFLSDFMKSPNGSITVRGLSQLIYDKIISRMRIGSFVLINDINHNDTRNCFDMLISAIERYKVVKKYRFEKPISVLQKYTIYYNNRGNKTIKIPKKYLSEGFQQAYSPRTDCSSAQVLVEVR